MNLIMKLFKNEDGATAIEYGLIAALIPVAAIGAMTTLGEEVTGTFEDAKEAIVAGRASANQ